jgi:cytochrome bd ubiquinol oxidase subunit I
MQTPAGGHMENGRFVVDSYLNAILSPDMPWGFSHMWVACLETSLFVIGGASAWHLLRGRNLAFFRKSLLLAFGLAVIVTPLQIWLGDGSGRRSSARRLRPTRLNSATIGRSRYQACSPGSRPGRSTGG